MLEEEHLSQKKEYRLSKKGINFVEEKKEKGWL